MSKQIPGLAKIKTVETIIKQPVIKQKKPSIKLNTVSSFYRK